MSVIFKNSFFVYKDILISTIVDFLNNLEKETDVYKDILISTIVDLSRDSGLYERLQGHINFYYCRFGICG